MELLVKKLKEDAILPTRAHDTDSGLDLYAYILDNTKPEEIVIYQRQRRLIPTGIAVKAPAPTVFDHLFELQIRPRSGLAHKYGVTCHWGTIDNSYTGELFVNVFNFGDKPFTVTQGMKIAQLVMAPIIIPKLKIVDELPVTDRGTSGYGSTGLYAT